jgi:hypothetical protein
VVQKTRHCIPCLLNVILGDVLFADFQLHASAATMTNLNDGTTAKKFLESVHNIYTVPDYNPVYDNNIFLDVSSLDNNYLEIPSHSFRSTMKLVDPGSAIWAIPLPETLQDWYEDVCKRWLEAERKNTLIWFPQTFQ